MSKQKRDAKGRFLRGEISLAIEEENWKAEKIAKICEALEISPEGLGMKKLESGDWFISYVTKPMLQGLALGLVQGLDGPIEKTRELLSLTAEILKIGRTPAPIEAKDPGARASA